MKRLNHPIYPGYVRLFSSNRTILITTIVTVLGMYFFATRESVWREYTPIAIPLYVGMMAWCATMLVAFIHGWSIDYRRRAKKSASQQTTFVTINV